jgi:hypothetical protein
MTLQNLPHDLKVRQLCQVWKMARWDSTIIRMKWAPLTLLVLASAVTFTPGIVSLAYGAAFFVETGGGISQIRGGEAFFGSDLPGVSGFGGSFNLGVFYNFTDMREPMAFQFGLHERYSSASTANYFSTHAPYAVIRIQVSRIYVSGGVSPLVYKRLSDSPGIDHFEKSLSTLSYLAEAGVLWPITEEFSLGASTSLQFVRASGISAFSPKPIVDLGVSMRFYFGHSTGASGKSSVEWPGWRYPFGWKVGEN